jgi:hypothetical protein
MVEVKVQVDLKPLQRFNSAVQEGFANPNASGNPVRTAIKQWSARYRGFVRDRFDRYSKGGGDWPPLALGTTRGRRDVRKRAIRLRKLKKELRSLTGKKGSSGWAAKMKKKRDQIDKVIQGNKNRTRTSTARDTRRGGIIVSAGGELMATVTILRDTGMLFNALDPNVEGRPGALSRDVPFGIEVGYGGPGRYPGGGPSISDIASFHNEGGGRLPKREIIVAPSEQVIEAMEKDMDRAIAQLGGRS